MANRQVKSVTLSITPGAQLKSGNKRFEGIYAAEATTTTLTLHAIVDLDSPAQDWNLWVVEVDQVLPDSANYLASCTVDGTVYHIFRQEPALAIHVPNYTQAPPGDPSAMVR